MQLPPKQRGTIRGDGPAPVEAGALGKIWGKERNRPFGYATYLDDLARSGTGVQG